MKGFQLIKTHKRLASLLLLCLILLLWLGVFYLKQAYQQQVYQQQKHYFRQSMLQFLGRQDGNIEAGAVIFIGDSHIQGLAVSSIAPRGVNFGIGGETSWQLRQRITDYVSLKQARCVFLATGINDVLLRDSGQTVDNIRAILNELGSDVVVLVSELIPLDESINGRHYLNQELRMLNQQLSALSETRPNVHMAQNHQLTGQDGLAPELHIGDGLHLNARGYALWINQIKGQLANFCEAKQ